MSHTVKRSRDDDIDDRHEPDRKVQRKRGQQPSFNERQEQWRERPMDWNAVLPANDFDGYRPETG